MPPKATNKRKAPSKAKPVSRRSKKEEVEEESSEEEAQISSEEDRNPENAEGENEDEVVTPQKKSRRQADKETASQKEAAPANSLGLEWTEHGSLYILDSKLLKHADKVVAFDMDGTLVNPKSGKKFPQSRSDWVWVHESIPDKLREYNKNGYKIVIFTNQGGIEKGKQKPTDITGKISDLSVELGFPIQAFVATATDHYRKPHMTMWKLFHDKYNGNVAIDVKQSFYVGDAAGRPKDWKKGAKKDFSCGDRGFAHNTGLTFKTPEEFFFGEAPVAFEWDSIDPHVTLTGLQDKKPYDEKDIIGNVTTQELVVMVGRPASGKSTFSKRYFVPKGYVHINQDTLKTKPACLKAAKKALEDGKSIIVDNTNGSRSNRAEYLAMAKEKGVPARCFWLDTDLDLCFHLNFHREKETSGGVRRIPDVAYAVFKKNWDEPSTDEGFTTVRKLEWIPHFENDDARKMFLERTG